MIQIPRSVVKQLRAIFRRLMPRGRNTVVPAVSFHAVESHLLVRLHRLDVSAEFRIDGQFATDTFVVPLDALAEFEGKDNSPVTLERVQSGGVQAKWDDKGIPRVLDCDAIDPSKLLTFPSEPE